MPLPNLVVIGAQKCGTTSLHHYLDLHPEISMGRARSQKELDFFAYEHQWRRGLAWYAAQFTDAPIRGDASNSYTAHPIYPFASERIGEILPDARLLYMVRDPVERAITAWHANVCYLDESRGLEEAFARLDDNEYVLRGCYATQLERYLLHFPDDRTLVVDQHDLRHDRAASLRRIFRFLEVDEHFTSPSFDEEKNPTDDFRMLTPIGRLVGATASHALGLGAMKRLRKLLPVNVPGLQRSAPERPRAEGELRERLLEHFAPEVERLRALTGGRFESWSL